MRVRASQKVPAAVILIVASLCYAVIFRPFGWVGLICTTVACIMIFIFGRKDHIAVAMPIISYVAIQLIREIVKLAIGRDHIRATIIDVMFVLFMLVELAFVVLALLKLFGPLKKMPAISFVLVGLLGYMCLYRMSAVLLYRSFYWGSLFTSLSGMLFSTAYMILILTQTIAGITAANRAPQQPVYQQPVQPAFQQPVAPQQSVQPAFQQPVAPQQPVVPQQPVDPQYAQWSMQPDQIVEHKED